MTYGDAYKRYCRTRAECDFEYFYKKFSPLLRFILSQRLSYNRDEIEQRIWVALWKAAKNYKFKYSSTSYINGIIRNQLYDAYDEYHRNFISIYSDLDERSKSHINTIESPTTVEDEALLEITTLQIYKNIIKQLSPLERNVFKAYLQSYLTTSSANLRAIAEMINIDVKCADNAIQRIRKKTRKYQIDHQITF